MSSTMIAEYLDENETALLRDRLKAEGVDPIVKRHGLPCIFGADSHFRIFIDGSHADKGRTIAGRVLAECAEKRAAHRRCLEKQCPRCHSFQVTIKEKTSLWLKFRFFGVTIRYCIKCGNIWYT